MNNKIPFPQSHIFYGGDYNPEQWSQDVWHEDMHLMKQAGVNLITLGVFSWAQLEPRPGIYEFDWFDKIISMLNENEIELCLATATASPPPWLAKHYPESLPVDVNGVKYFPGGRQAYCPHSEAYKTSAKALVTQLAQRYGKHPALKIWHINNEYGCHINECFCDVSAQVFREWLQARYQSINTLNDAWGTAFWSQRYGDWDEINPPRRAPTFPNPTQHLDWRRFSSDSLLDLMNMEKGILRELTPNIPVTTNFLGFWKTTDYWKWSKHGDVISMDAYPNPATPLPSNIEFAMQCDFMRSIGNGKPWILMEQTPSAVNWRAQNLPKQPNQMRLWSLASVVRGAGAIMFFQWRASKAGAEKFHSGMVQHVGTARSRVWDEVSRLGSDLKRLSPLLETKVKAEVAVMLDWESWWALELDSKPSMSIKHQEQLAHHFGPLFCSGITTDFVHPESDLSAYKLVVIPNLYLVRAEHAENITRYVENGGMVFMSFFSGIVNEHEHIWMGGYPAPFRKMLGLTVEEFVPFMPEQTSAVRLDGVEISCSLWADVIHLEGAQALGTFQQDFYTGKPALTRNHFGNGTAYYLGTRLTADVMQKVIAQVVVDAGITSTLSVPAGVDVVLREGAGQLFLCVMNTLPETVSVDLQSYHGTDLLTDDALESQISIEPYGVRILAV